MKLKFCAILVVGLSASCGIFIRPALAQGEVVPVAEQAQAVFKKRCASCHSQSQARGGLDMTSLEGILAGSNSGAVVEPGKPEESLVYTLSAHQDTPKMPPNAPKIPQRELNSIAAWIKSLNQGVDVKPRPREMSTSVDGEDANGERTLVDGLVAVEPVAGPLAITAVAANQALVAVSGNHQVLLLDSTTNTWLGALNFPEGDVFVLKFSTDGSRLIAAGGVGGQSGNVVCWELPTYRRLANVKIDDDVVLAMDVSPNGRTVAVGGPKRTIEIIDLSSGKRQHILRKHADWVTKLSFSGDGVFLASADRFGSIYLWDATDGSLFDNAGSHAGVVTALQFSDDSNVLWSAGKDGEVHKWDLQQNQLTQRWIASNTGVASMISVKDQLYVVDNERRLSGFSSGGEQLFQKSLERELTTLAAIASTGQMVIGDTQSGLTIGYPDMDREVRTIHVPRRSLPVKANRFSAKPVERQLQASQPVESPAAQDAGSEDAIAQARLAIEASRSAVVKAKHSLAELEEKVLELQRALDRLGNR